MPAAPTRPRRLPRSAPPGARPATWSIRIRRWRWRWPIATPRDSKVPNIVLSTAHPAKFPDAVEAACGVRPQLPAWLDGLMTRPEQITVMKNDSRRSRTIRALGEPCREAGSCRMSVDVTRLPSGLTVVTDTMPHLETAALGVWTGVGGRDEKPNEHGISHLLEHMAFKGTTSAFLARDRRGDRGGRRRSQCGVPRPRPPPIMRGC